MSRVGKKTRCKGRRRSKNKRKRFGYRSRNTRRSLGSRHKRGGAPYTKTKKNIIKSSKSTVPTIKSVRLKQEELRLLRLESERQEEVQGAYDICEGCRNSEAFNPDEHTCVFDILNILAHDKYEDLPNYYNYD